MFSGASSAPATSLTRGAAGAALVSSFFASSSTAPKPNVVGVGLLLSSKRVDCRRLEWNGSVCSAEVAHHQPARQTPTPRPAKNRVLIRLASMRTHHVLGVR